MSKSSLSLDINNKSIISYNISKNNNNYNNHINHNTFQSSCSNSTNNLGKRKFNYQLNLPELKKQKISNNNPCITQDKIQYPSSASSRNLPSHGRTWTDIENELFIKGLEIHGRGKWVQIAKYIKTRNALQVKNHARYYYQKLESNKQDNIKNKKYYKNNKSYNNKIKNINQDKQNIKLSNDSDIYIYSDSETEEDEDLQIKLDNINILKSSILPKIPENVSKIIPPRGNIIKVLSERDLLVANLPNPLKEIDFPPSDNISEHEKVYNKEFFINNSCKTPERYIRIRNFCLDTWKEYKPSYVSKTTVRLGLKDCGDVNAIGRVHEYLEKLGAINFGAKSRKYTKKEKPLQSNQSIKSNKDNILINSIKRPQRKCVSKKKEQLKNTLEIESISPIPYGKRQPFKLYISTNIYTIMDINSRLVSSQVYGLLGGSYNEIDKILYIDMIVPCEVSDTKCKIDKEAEKYAKNYIYKHGKSFIGWYHSHPEISPNPSKEDINTQFKYQNDTEDLIEPFIGIIVSPCKDKKSTSYCFYNVTSGTALSKTLRCFPKPKVRPLLSNQDLIQEVKSLIEDFETQSNRVLLLEKIKGKSLLSSLITSISTIPTLKEDIISEIRSMLTESFKH